MKRQALLNTAKAAEMAAVWMVVCVAGMPRCAKLYYYTPVKK
jgi:hypothetical protein